MDVFPGGSAWESSSEELAISDDGLTVKHRLPVQNMDDYDFFDWCALSTFKILSGHHVFNFAINEQVDGCRGNTVHLGVMDGDGGEGVGVYAFTGEVFNFERSDNRIGHVRSFFSAGEVRTLNIHIDMEARSVAIQVNSGDRHIVWDMAPAALRIFATFSNGLDQATDCESVTLTQHVGSWAGAYSMQTRIIQVSRQHDVLTGTTLSGDEIFRVAWADAEMQDAPCLITAGELRETVSEALQEPLETFLIMAGGHEMALTEEVEDVSLVYLMQDYPLESFSMRAKLHVEERLVSDIPKIARQLCRLIYSKNLQHPKP